jgi:hypothetical protein
MRITPTRLKLDYYRGVRKLTDHPCSVCREGIKFAEVPHFHGSDFGKCGRSVHYEKIVNGHKEHSDLTAAQFNDGHMHEAQIVAALRQEGYEITGREDWDTDEFIVALDVISGRVRRIMDSPSNARKWKMEDLSETEILIIGHTDGVINSKALLECKAVRDRAFEDKFRKRKLPYNYKQQMRIYMLSLGLETGYLFVKSRHFSEPLVFEVPRDDEEVLKRAREFHAIKAVEGGARPDWLPCNPQGGEHYYCRACKAFKGGFK